MGIFGVRGELLCYTKLLQKGNKKGYLHIGTFFINRGRIAPQMKGR
jgi:hypothetical protein